MESVCYPAKESDDAYDVSVSLTFSFGPQTSLETSAAPRCETLQGRTACWTTTERMHPRNQQTFFSHPGVVISNTLATVWIAYRGSVVKCARSQVRPFTKNDEAAHEHVTEQMRDLGERLLHEGDFSYEDITGHDEPPVGSPPAPGENTVTGPDGEGTDGCGLRSAKTNERKNPTRQP